MVSQNKNSHNQSASRNAKTAGSKFPSLADCKRVTKGGNAEAVVLQKLCHYDSKARFEIEGDLFTAPTTEMLQRELGLARSTIQKSLRSLEDKFIIQIKQGRWNRSPRRYIRVVIDPAIHESDLLTQSGCAKSDGANSDLETLSPSEDQTVYIKKKKKKKIQKKSQPIQEKDFKVLDALSPSDPPKYSQEEFCSALAGQSEKTAPAAPVDLPPKDQLWQPDNFYQRLELRNFRDQAKAHSYSVRGTLAKRRGWDMQGKIDFQNALLNRWEREFRRGRASGKIAPAKSGSPWPKYF